MSGENVDSGGIDVVRRSSLLALYDRLNHYICMVKPQSVDAKLEPDCGCDLGDEPEVATLLTVTFSFHLRSPYVLFRLVQVCAEMAKEEKATRAFDKWELVRMLQEKRQMANEEIAIR